MRKCLAVFQLWFGPLELFFRIHWNYVHSKLKAARSTDVVPMLVAVSCKSSSLQRFPESYSWLLSFLSSKLKRTHVQLQRPRQPWFLHSASPTASLTRFVDLSKIRVRAQRTKNWYIHCVKAVYRLQVIGSKNSPKVIVTQRCHRAFMWSLWRWTTQSCEPAKPSEPWRCSVREALGESQYSFSPNQPLTVGIKQ